MHNIGLLMIIGGSVIAIYYILYLVMERVLTPSPYTRKSGLYFVTILNPIGTQEIASVAWWNDDAGVWVDASHQEILFSHKVLRVGRYLGIKNQVVEVPQPQ